MEPPPWRARSFASITAPAGLDDVRAKELLLAAIVGVDGLEDLDAVASALNVSKRTVQRARQWFERHEPASFARLRPRVPGRPAAKGVTG